MEKGERSWKLSSVFKIVILILKIEKNQKIIFHLLRKETKLVLLN